MDDKQVVLANPLEQEGFTVNEAPVVMFFEVIKKLSEDEYAVIHTTIRDLSDENAQGRLDWHIQTFEAKGYRLQDAPKKNAFAPRGGGGKSSKPRADIPESGRFEVVALTREFKNDKHNLKLHGPNGEEAMDWEGRQSEALMKTSPEYAAIISGWASWPLNEEHRVPWTSHKLIGQCNPPKEFNGRKFWNIKSLSIE